MSLILLDELAVSFTFKLQTGHETAYKVERVFKRTDAVKVKTSICRFIEMKEEQIVLADKANEVNRKIEIPGRRALFSCARSNDPGFSAARP